LEKEISFLKSEAYLLIGCRDMRDRAIPEKPFIWEIKRVVGIK